MPMIDDFFFLMWAEKARAVIDKCEEVGIECRIVEFVEPKPKDMRGMPTNE
jgi:hypothetical protein